MLSQTRDVGASDGRRTRSWVFSLVAAFLLALVMVPAGPAGTGAPAAVAIDPSRGTPGPCADDTGVTVVVDFQALGSHGGHDGGVIVRCAQGSGMTGLDALHNAGFQVSGTTRWGQGFICRLEGRPAADEPLPIDGNDGYTEPCVDTPPAQAFWSYWTAEKGGPWVFSQLGVKNRTVPEGTFEGWSFSLNGTASSNPAPRFSPQRETSPQPTSPGDDGDGGDAPGTSTEPGAGTAPGAGSGAEESGDSDPPTDTTGGPPGGAQQGVDGPTAAPVTDPEAGGAPAEAAPPLPRPQLDGGQGAEAQSEGGDARGEDEAQVTQDGAWSGGEDAAPPPQKSGTGLPVSVLGTGVVLLLLASLAFVGSRRRGPSA